MHACMDACMHAWMDRRTASGYKEISFGLHSYGCTWVHRSTLVCTHAKFYKIKCVIEQSFMFPTIFFNYVSNCMLLKREAEASNVLYSHIRKSVMSVKSIHEEKASFSTIYSFRAGIYYTTGMQT